MPRLQTMAPQEQKGLTIKGGRDSQPLPPLFFEDNPEPVFLELLSPSPGRP